MPRLKCQKGFIVRNGYLRKGYTRKNGTKIKKTHIKAKCIKSRGGPGKTSLRFKNGKGIPPLKRGELGKHGYKKIKTLGVRKRHKALSLAIKEYGSKKIFGKLGALRTYQKRTSPEISKLFTDNMKWVRKKYDHDFTSSFKDSALFKN